MPLSGHKNRPASVIIPLVGRKEHSRNGHFDQAKQTDEVDVGVGRGEHSLVDTAGVVV
jgi:hypothetical protein